ncbi:unnamed protein product [Schistocephalus solidus]|uniref:BK channel n=1 Tax=Schistocephalus solidus TaxID=70667 RepID=A0A183SKP5_SCHSO|nr:unnamed protein product [Schistocephalus solidus]
MRYEKSRKSLEICLPFWKNTIQQLDLLFNICFFMHFMARFITADDYLFFWFELFSIVDILTIPPSFLALFLGRSWLGLRFARCLTVLTFKDVLQYLNILRSSTAIRLCQLVTFFAGLVLSASGFVHLVENSGDPPNFDNPQYLSYFDCLYLCIVTVATVGYGDFTCKTIMGRAFMIAFILVALAVFANAIPEIADIVNSRTKYGGTYVRRLGKPHLVLCGHITFNTVKNFLSDFLHKDREDVVTQIVILDQQEPNLELQGLLKRYENQVHFYQVSRLLNQIHALLALKMQNTRNTYFLEKNTRPVRILNPYRPAPALPFCEDYGGYRLIMTAELSNRPIDCVNNQNDFPVTKSRFKRRFCNKKSSAYQGVIMRSQKERRRDPNSGSPFES